LFGFDFTVEYRPIRLNTVANALSHRDAEHASKVVAELGAMCVRSEPTLAFLEDMRQEIVRAPDAQDMLWRLGDDKIQAPWRFNGGLLLHGNRIFLPDHSDLRH
jgi:hypothetical protein